MLLLLRQLHFLLLQLPCFFLSLFSFFRFRSSSIFRLFFFFFFFKSSAPSDPYSRSAAAASSTPSISNLKNIFAAKTLPKLLYFPPPLVLVLCFPSTPLFLPMLIILFQLLPPAADAAAASSTPINQQPQKTDLRPQKKKKTKRLPKLLHFLPLLILLTLLLLLQNLCFFRDLLFSFTSSRCSHF